MKYRIVRSEDLDRITLYTVKDAGSAAAAVEAVPTEVPLPDRVTAVCGEETVVVVSPTDPTPAIVVRGVQDPIPVPDPPVEEEPPVEEPPYPEGDPSDTWTVSQLEAWLDAHYAPWRDEIVGTGTDGNVLKADLLAFIGSLTPTE